MKKTFILAFSLSLCALVIFTQRAEAQSFLTVTDEEGAPLFKAMLVYEVLGERKALFSDEQGVLTIYDRYFVTDTLRGELKFLGMLDNSVTIARSAKLSIAMRTDPMLLQEMVITGEYAETHPEHSVHRIEVISAAEIESLGANELGDVLQHAGNIQIRQDAVIGTGISMQGLDDRNIKVCINEVPIIGRVDGKLDLGQIDLDDIERIEIVRGPMAVSYGTDAIAGVINIITKKADQKGQDISMHAEASSEGQYDISGRYSSRSEQYGFALRAGRRYFDGWSPSDRPFQESEAIADGRRDRSWNPKEQYSIGIDHTLFRKKGEWTHRLNFLDEELLDRGSPIINDVSQSIVALDDLYKTTRLDNSLALSRTIGTEVKYNGFVAHNYYLRNRDQLLTDLTGVDSRSVEEDSTIYHALTTRHTFSHAYSESLGTQFGMDGSWESSRGERIAESPDFWQLAGFISMEWEPLDGLLLRPGIRGGYHSAFKMPFVPSLAFRYRQGSHTLRASYGRGFRAPAFKELYLAFFDSNHNVYGNPDLEPERSHNLGLSHNFSKHTARLRWNTEVSFFYNRIEDLISLVQDGLGNEGIAPFTYRNVDQVTTQGGMLSGELSSDGLKLGLGFGLTGKEQFENDTLLVPMNYFEQVSASLGYVMEEHGIGISINWTYNGAQDRVIIRDEDLERLHQSGYGMLDLNLSKSLMGKRMSLDLGVRNLLDVTDVEVSGGQGAHQGARDRTLLAIGRNYFISFKYHLKLKKG